LPLAGIVSGTIENIQNSQQEKDLLAFQEILPQIENKIIGKTQKQKNELISLVRESQEEYERLVKTTSDTSELKDEEIEKLQQVEVKLKKRGEKLFSEKEIAIKNLKNQRDEFQQELESTRTLAQNSASEKITLTTSLNSAKSQLEATQTQKNNLENDKKSLQEHFNILQDEKI
jgi:hypothetical protein